MATERWHLTFPEHLVRQPVVYRLVRDHDLVINIRRADVDDEVGWMVLECTGEPDRLQGARAWLSGLGVVVTGVDGDVMAG
jgi:hypothetical protein